jgi:VWFA-related protein
MPTAPETAYACGTAMTVLPALVLAAASTGLAQAQQRTPPEFPTDVRLIRLDVSVVDKSGRPVPGLLQEHFEVKEDGRSVPVSYFEAVSAHHAAVLDAAAEVPAAAEPAAPRRILLLVDTGAMTPGEMLRARQAVTGYVAQARDGEWVRLANLGTGELWDGWMPDERSGILAAARSLQRRPSPWAVRASDADARIVERSERAPDPDQPSEAETSSRSLSIFAQGAGLLGTLEALITELEGVPGRKALVLISPGFPQMRGLDRRLERVATLARGAATTVYYVDAAGQDGLIPEYGQKMRPAFEMAWMRSGGAQDLAEATGGFTSRFDNSLLPALARASAEMRTYYVLGYAPPRADGRFRRVSVKVKVPGLSARTKKGYLAPR